MSKYVHKRRNKDLGATGGGWHLWCRLCANEDTADSRDIFIEQIYETGYDERIKLEDDDGGSFLNVAAVIEKFYAVQINNDDDLPRILCDDCYVQINSLIAFGFRLSRVQKMFDELQLAEQMKNIKINLSETRLKYGISKKRTSLQNSVERNVNNGEYNNITKENTEIEHESDENTFSEEEDIYMNDAEIDDYTQENDNCREFESINVSEEFVTVNEENSTKETYDFETHAKIQDSPKLTLHVDSFEYFEDVNSNSSFNQDAEFSPEREETISIPPESECGSEYEISLFSESQDSSVDNPLKTNNNTTSVPKKRKPQAKPKYWMSCTECPSKFTRLTYYKKHMKSKHNKTVEQPTIACPDCDRVFRQYHELVRHSQSHIPVELRRVVKCPHCNIKLACKASLNTHIRFVHLNERNYVCSECGASFARGHALKTHMLMHSGLLPYVCEVCNRGFKEKSKLRLHMDVHTTDKHICPECGVQLNSRYTLRDHMTIHSNKMPFKCEYCGRAFKRRVKLKFHLLRHVGLKPYSCNFCEDAFTTSADCVSHLRKTHLEEYIDMKSRSSEKGYTSNMPTLAELRSITKVATDLKPVANRRQPPSNDVPNPQKKA